MRRLAAILGVLAIVAIIVLSTFVLRFPLGELKTTIGEPFTLKIGQSAFIQSDNIKVTLLNVTEDSRCPIGVECIWAGQAGVLITIEKGGQNMGDFKLITDPGNSTADFDIYQIKLKIVEPYPRAGEKIQPEDYKAGLIVYRS